MNAFVIICAGCLLSVGAGVANAAPDLSGVWRISTPIGALKTVDGQLPPLTPAALQVYQQHLQSRAAGTAVWDDTTACKPPGEPRALYEQSWPFQIAQSDERVLFLFQWNRLVRVIEMGRALPDFDGPFYFGRSSGSWQGNTLVVHVIGIRAETTLDAAGLPHSDDLHLLERFRLIDGGKRLEARLHFEDAANYTRAWDARLVFDRLPDDAIVEDHCLDRLTLPNSYRPTLSDARP